MPKIRLKQLAQDGAVDGELLRFNATTGEWESIGILVSTGLDVTGANTLAVGGALESNYLMTMRGSATQNGLFIKVTDDPGTSPLHIEDFDGTIQYLHIDENEGAIGLGTVNPTFGVDNQRIGGPGNPGADYNTAGGVYRCNGEAMPFKLSCRVATTANITLSGTQTIDGVAVVVGDRVLVKDQTAGAENGTYIVAAGAWSRSSDFNRDDDATSGSLIAVAEGTAKADTLWMLTTNAPITLGATSLTFAQQGTVIGPVRREKHITIENPSASEDISWFFANRAITITEIRAVLVQSAASPSVTWTVRHGTDRSAAGAEVVTGGTTTTSETAGDDITTFNDATIVADSHVWVETTASANAAQLALTIFYIED